MSAINLPPCIIGHDMRKYLDQLDQESENQKAMEEKMKQDAVDRRLIIKRVCFAAGFTVLMVALLIVRGG